jgi:hypothetical protein
MSRKILKLFWKTDANVFFNIAIPKFAAQAIRKAAELNWKPVPGVGTAQVRRATVEPLLA